MIDNLIQAYKNTKYKVFKPNLIIEIGVMNNDPNDLLAKNNAIEWAYITAFNPYSKVLTRLQTDTKTQYLILFDTQAHPNIVENFFGLFLSINFLSLILDII